MRTLQQIFQDRFALIEIEGEGHSTLAGSFDQGAFADTIRYPKVRLRAEPGPKQMSLAKLDGKECQITADGKWRAL